MNEYPDFEENYYWRIAVGVYRIGQDSIRLMKFLT